VFSLTPNLAIPDHAAMGVTAEIPVMGVDGPVGRAVTVDITHPYRGDLVIELLKNGTKLKTLAANSGGSADDVHETYTFTPDEVGAPTATWAVRVVDTADADIGTLDAITLSFE
jgi:subtilisin-like proprotein convertase family protein